MVVSALVVIGLAALILGFFHILNQIRSPFAVDRALDEVATVSDAEEQRLKELDTDEDGLSDFDELTLTSTSPYLKDSDSDGKDDQAELLVGQDPNCPAGQVCGLAVTGLATNSNAAGNVNATLPGLLGTSVTTDSLRQTLKEAGAPAYIVDNTDDATLLKLYEDVLAGSTTNGNTSLDDRQLFAALKNLEPSEIRELLRSGGVDASSLEQVSDQDLITIFQRAVEEEISAPATP